MTLKDYIVENVREMSSYPRYLEMAGVDELRDAAEIELTYVCDSDNGQVFELSGTGLLLWSGQADTLIDERREPNYTVSGKYQEIPLSTDDTFTLAIGTFDIRGYEESTPQMLRDLIPVEELIRIYCDSNDSNEHAKLEKAIGTVTCPNCDSPVSPSNQ